MSASSTPSRRPQACERCWKRKQKVGLGFYDFVPNIHWLIRIVPVEPSEEGSGLSHAALPGYIESLTQRTRELEALTSKKRRRVSSDDPDGDATRPMPPEGLDSSVQAALGEIGFLSRSAMAEPREGASGFPRQLAMSEMIQAMLSLSGATPSHSCRSEAEAAPWNLLLVPDPRQALSKDFATPFLRRFLDCIHMYYLYFDRAELEEQCEAFFGRTSNESGELSAAAQSYRDFSVYLAISVGMLLSPQSGRVDLLAQSLHSAAVKLLPMILQCGNCLNLIHCLVLLVVYSILSPNGGSTWHMLGLAMMRCVAFGMHKEQDIDSALPVEESARRKSLLWTLYSLDRRICTSMDRPFGIQDQDISLALPEQGPVNADGHDAFEFHLLMYAKLISSIRDSDERCPFFHYRNICFWRDVPRELGPFLDQNETARDHLKQLSCRALIQILPLCTFSNTGSQISESSSLEIERDVRSSCEEMIDRMYRSLDHSPAGFAFTDGYDVFAAGVAILCTGDVTLAQNLAPDPAGISKCVALLTVVGERFAGVKVFRRVLLARPKMAPGIIDSSEKTVAAPVLAEKRTVYMIDSLHPDAVEYAKTLWNVILPGDKRLTNWQEHASAILVRGSYVTADDIARAPNLIAIGKHGVGIDKIDQRACAKRGIKILNTPGANSRDVAELVVTLTMTVARGIRSITTRQMAAPVPKETCTGLTLYRKTIGIIGMGNIGRMVAEIFYGGFDAKLVAYDAYMPDDAWPHLPHQRAQSVQEVIEAADVLTLHVPLTEETRNLISYKQLRQMKPDAILINAARGGIVNEQDLAQVLSEGHLWGAGLDCHEQEPPSVERYGKLWENLNVVSTPHIGAATNTAQRATVSRLGFDPLDPGAVPPDILYIPLHTIGDEQGLSILPSKAAVGQILPPLRGKTVHAPSWIGQAGLPVVGKVVGTFKTLEVTPGQERCDFVASPFGSPSYLTHSLTVLSSSTLSTSTRKIRPCGISTKYRAPSGAQTGPSRKMSDGGPAKPPRHSVVNAVRRAEKTSPGPFLNAMGLIADTRKAFREAPKGIFNTYLFSFGIYHLSDDEYAGTKGWIVSIATAGAVFGCLGSLPINDQVGRRWTLRLGTLVYIAGVLGQGLSGGSLAGLYASRDISGMGIGVTTIVPPVFISEISPKAIRGLLTLQYAACQQLGVVLGFFINYGVTRKYANTDTQWMLPTLLQLLPAGLWGLGTFLCPESPRWLLSVGRREEAAAALSRLRHLPPGHPVVAGELAGMDSQIQHEHESVASASPWQLLKETIVPVENRRRFFLLFMATLFSQWSGANAITQYSPTIFGYLGIVGDEATFLATGIYGVVKFVSTLAFALVIVDFVGRRRSLLTGISLQILKLVFVGAYLGATKDMTITEVKASGHAERASTAAIVAIYLHAVAWSIGWFSIPYLIGPEIFPTRIRSLNMSISMALHWAFYFGCSKAMPSLLAATHRWGAFLFFSCIGVLGLIYVSLAMPDTTGRSLEALDRLFERPWYTMYKVAYASQDELRAEQPGDEYSTMKGPRASAKHVEAARER
ncbi:hypothetical protein BDW67DRAFT_193607 [Aspergillus spinulosporus]